MDCSVRFEVCKQIGGLFGSDLRNCVYNKIRIKITNGIELSDSHE